MIVYIVQWSATEYPSSWVSFLPTPSALLCLATLLKGGKPERLPLVLPEEHFFPISSFSSRLWKKTGHTVSTAAWAEMVGASRQLCLLEGLKYGHLPVRTTPLPARVCCGRRLLHTPVAFLNLSSYSNGTVTQFLTPIPLEDQVCVFLLSRYSSGMR